MSSYCCCCCLFPLFLSNSDEYSVSEFLLIFLCFGFQINFIFILLLYDTFRSISFINGYFQENIFLLFGNQNQTKIKRAELLSTKINNSTGKSYVYAYTKEGRVANIMPMIKLINRFLICLYASLFVYVSLYL